MNPVSSLADTALTLTQALELVGLAPCILVVVFLLGLARRNVQVLIPACYFVSLACGFALPLLDIFFPFSPHRGLTGALLLGESMLVAFGFLMILQFMTGRVPPLRYWLVLAIPAIGGGVLLYASLVAGNDACLQEQRCIDVQSMRTLYNIFGSSLLFLLLMVYAARFPGLTEGDVYKRHKYALMVALILLHLLMLAVELAQLAGHLTLAQARFVETMFRLTFIYVALTSLFRVFYPRLIGDIVPIARYNPEADVPHAAAIRALLENERVYREMRLNRAALAKKAGIGEYHLSRVINRHFGKSFNDLINDYRIEEAKQRLKSESTQVTIIAFETGFNSIASFNRVFKAKVGVSPTEYREA